MYKRLIYIVLALLFVACSGDVETEIPIDMKQLQEDLVEANKKALKVESNQIDEYIERKGLEVIKTPTGLRYGIYKKGNGEGKIILGQKAVVKYTVSLLNDTVCYTTANELEQFTVGKDYVETGLHEGIQYMLKGDKAIIIIPSYLAHGTAGDFKKIPLRSTIVYDIELVDIK